MREGTSHKLAPGLPGDKDVGGGAAAKAVATTGSDRDRPCGHFVAAAFAAESAIEPDFPGPSPGLD